MKGGGNALVTYLYYNEGRKVNSEILKMPDSPDGALNFLETQWPSINENKIKGIIAETDFRRLLKQVGNVQYVPGGWIVVPGKCNHVTVPANHKICLLPISQSFSWQPAGITPPPSPSSADISAYNFFRQVGITPYFVTPDSIIESDFQLPTKTDKVKKTKSNYPKPYKLSFLKTSPTGAGTLTAADFENEVMMCFPKRNGNTGQNAHALGRLDKSISPWNDLDTVSSLFWFEYARYYCQTQYMVSNSDLDMFLIGNSGLVFPVEIKSKSVANDKTLGDWFGLDVGPFAKMSFFTANSQNTDALYVVQEVDASTGVHVDWLGIRFTDLVKSCSWVLQAGGKGMTGGASTTVKTPKAAFTQLSTLLKSL